ncbi:MAG: ribonuclease HII [Parcubacteria group bacterium]
MIKSTFDLENQLIADGYEFIIGIDEAGRGPLAGPVVASAVCFKTSDVFIGLRHPMSKLIRDSKMLSEKQRESLFDFIHEYFHVGVGICDHKTIDRINILEATFLAMKAAVTDLKKARKRFDQASRFNLRIAKGYIKVEPRMIILLDGNKKIPNLSIEQKAIVNGDKFVKSISAASIVAKVTRDRIMREMHEKFPQYNFAQHKGYGTKLHFEMLEKNGPCEIHRQSFAPVKSALRKRIE